MDSLRLVSLGVGRRDFAEALYGQLNEARRTGANDALSIDLSQVAFMPARELLALVTVARLWHRWTGRPTTLSGMQRPVHQYLERMDLFSTCGDWIKPECRLDPSERLGRSRASRKLLEVMPIAAEEWLNACNVTDAVERARRILGWWFGADEPAIPRLCRMLSEIASNVVHSEDRGFAVIQHYREPGIVSSGGQVTIAVADLGIGIPSSLRVKYGQHGMLSSGSGAILRAFDLGVTGRETVGGLGLAVVKGIVKDWQGVLTVRSDCSIVRFEGDQVAYEDGIPAVPGTQVTITVRGSAAAEPPF